MCMKGRNSNVNSNEIKFALDMIEQSEGWTRDEASFPNILVELLFHMCPQIEDKDFVMKGLIIDHAVVVEDYSASKHENVPRTRSKTRMHYLKHQIV